MAENITKIILIQPKHGYAKKYRRAYNIRDHQKRKRLKKKWDTIISRYKKKYTTEKYITGSGSIVVNIVDQTAVTTLNGYCPLIPITFNKGPEN